MAHAIATGTARSKPVDAGLLLPPAAMIIYHVALYRHRGLLLLFTPQLLAYAAMLTGWRKGGAGALGLNSYRMTASVLKGTAVGLLLGAVNLWVILRGAPMLGIDYQFLRATPHARLPFWVMFPAGIFLIALFVELNFRGWFLARLLSTLESGGPSALRQGVALIGSAVAFSFDPFMVVYFGAFHWLALSDGLVWGLLRLRTGSLWAPVAAHTAEVEMTYVVLKLFYA